MQRRVVLIAVWALGTLASIALAWTAVSVVGGQVTEGPPGDLTAQEVADAAADATTTTAPTTSTETTPPPTEPTSASGPAPTDPPPTAPAPTEPAPSTAEATSTRTFDSRGGTVGVRCVGNQSSLAFATPRSGYETEINDSGPGKVDVRFEADELESRVVVSCEAGTPSPQIREHDDD